MARRGTAGRDENHGPLLEKTQVSCNASFQDGTLRCVTLPSTLPIAPTTGGLCEDNFAALNLVSGPHDARAFWGPHQPYIIYGSNSMRICLGQFAQDLRALVDWEEGDSASEFFCGS